MEEHNTWTEEDVVKLQNEAKQKLNEQIHHLVFPLNESNNHQVFDVFMLENDGKKLSDEDLEKILSIYKEERRKGNSIKDAQRKISGEFGYSASGDPRTVRNWFHDIKTEKIYGDKWANAFYNVEQELKNNRKSSSPSAYSGRGNRGGDPSFYPGDKKQSNYADYITKVFPGEFYDDSSNLKQQAHTLIDKIVGKKERVPGEKYPQKIAGLKFPVVFLFGYKISGTGLFYELWFNTVKDRFEIYNRHAARVDKGVAANINDAIRIFTEMIVQQEQIDEDEKEQILSKVRNIERKAEKSAEQSYRNAKEVSDDFTNKTQGEQKAFDRTVEKYKKDIKSASTKDQIYDLWDNFQKQLKKHKNDIPESRYYEARTEISQLVNFKLREFSSNKKKQTKSNASSKRTSDQKESFDEKFFSELKDQIDYIKTADSPKDIISSYNHFIETWSKDDLQKRKGEYDEYVNQFKRMAEERLSKLFNKEMKSIESEIEDVDSVETLQKLKQNLYNKWNDVNTDKFIDQKYVKSELSRITRAINKKIKELTSVEKIGSEEVSFDRHSNREDNDKVAASETEQEGSIKDYRIGDDEEFSGQDKSSSKEPEQLDFDFEAEDNIEDYQIGNNEISNDEESSERDKSSSKADKIRIDKIKNKPNQSDDDWKKAVNESQDISLFEYYLYEQDSVQDIQDLIAYNTIAIYEDESRASRKHISFFKKKWSKIVNSIFGVNTTNRDIMIPKKNLQKGIVQQGKVLSNLNFKDDRAIGAFVRGYTLKDVVNVEIWEVVYKPTFWDQFTNFGRLDKTSRVTFWVFNITSGAIIEHDLQTLAAAEREAAKKIAVISRRKEMIQSDKKRGQEEKELERLGMSSQKRREEEAKRKNSSDRKTDSKKDDFLSKLDDDDLDI